MYTCSIQAPHSWGECEKHPDNREREAKRCPECSVGPRYGAQPAETPHASWCSRRGETFTGPTTRKGTTR